jgi:N-acetylglucosamine-6-phosphate deacetylase
MKRYVIRARALGMAVAAPLEDKLIVISGKRIESILPSSAANRFKNYDFVGGTKRYLVLPGLVDIHCHGGGGMDPNTLGGILAAAYFHASHGTSAMMMSVFYTGLNELRQMAELIREARPLAPLHLLGLHLEGPYINSEARGSLPLESLRSIRPSDLPKLLAAGLDELKAITIAPELPNAEAAIRFFSQAGLVVSIGHSLATAEQGQLAAEWGATLVTHLGNGMRPFHQREPGLVGAGLSDPRLAVELIADGQHLAKETMSMFLRAKNGESVIVSDCRWVGGLPNGSHQVDSEMLQVENGAAHQPDGTLAGGIHPLWKGLNTVASLPGFTFWEAALLGTVAPARVLGKKNLGRIAVGGRADLVLAGPDFNVLRVFFGGEEIFRESSELPLSE